MDHLKVASLGYALALPMNIGIARKGLDRHKPSSLKGKSVYYGRKLFYKIGPRSYAIKKVKTDNILVRSLLLSEVKLLLSYH